MVTYRCNIMNINSLETFAGVRGGFNAGVRDVYFARILGASKDIQSRIVEIDKKMGMDMYGGKLDYHRISNLPKLSVRDDIDFYTKIYDTYLDDKSQISLKTCPTNASLNDAISAALNLVLKIYKDENDAATDSMVKNFAVKILFWTDSVGKEILAHWEEKRCIKVIAENIVKEHEYLFFYFLAQIGCDVLLLELEKDAEVNDKLKKLSQIVSEDVFQNIVMPEYKKYIPEKKKNIPEEGRKISSVENTENDGRKVTVVIPERNRKKKDYNVSAETVNNSSQTSSVQTAVNKISSTQSTSRTNERREKTFEELAQLASSIVMIAVHDRTGDVEATGSGIMIGKDGYILTNCHVISGGRSFSVRIEDDENIYRTDEVIKYNSNLDLAVIRIRKKLNPLPIYRGKQKLVRGQKVVAIGSPLGLFNSVSDGIISGFRTIRDEDMIQFTAPISHGSSGGAVLNMYGEVIGISTAGIDAGQNINLAMGYESILTFAKGFY